MANDWPLCYYRAQHCTPDVTVMRVSGCQALALSSSLGCNAEPVWSACSSRHYKVLHQHASLEAAAFTGHPRPLHSYLLNLLCVSSFCEVCTLQSAHTLVNLRWSQVMNLGFKNTKGSSKLKGLEKRTNEQGFDKRTSVSSAWECFVWHLSPFTTDKP